MKNLLFVYSTNSGLNFNVKPFVLLIITVISTLFVGVKAQNLGTFEVLSVDHASGDLGKYFNFSIVEVDEIIGNTDWDGINVQIRNDETGQVAKAILWRSSNGGSVGDGHGRWDDGTANPWQWRVGDNLTILGRGVFDVKSVDHASGDLGKYFNWLFMDSKGLAKSPTETVIRCDL